MKKILVISGLMMAAIVALTGCQPKNVAEQLPERVLTVAAFTDDGTKTYNDGLSVLWAEDDALSMFYSNPEGGYLSAGKFTISDGVGTKRGIFTGTAPELAAGSYDWYAIYPYNAKLTTPASTDASGGYVYVGRKGGMYQPEYDANIPDYTVCPMYGVCKGVQAGDAPAFTIKQMTSIIELNIVNSTGKTVKINYAELDETESGEMITGTFYADITADPPVLSGDDPQYVSPLSRTNITNPGELAPGETAKIYLTVKPFTHDSSKAFKVRISGYVGEDTATTVVELNPAADKCTFHPGKIKKVTVPLENVEIKDGNSVADVVNGTVGDSYIVKDALVTMVYNKGFFATDGAGTILVYMNAAPAVAKGDKVDIDGVSSTYSNMVQFNRPTVTVKSKENPVSMPEPLIYTGTEVDAAAAAPTNAYVIVTATMTSATAATVEGATATLSVNAGTDPAISLEQGKTYKLTGYVYGYYNGKVYLYADSAEEVGDTPGPGPDPDPQGTMVEVVMKDYVSEHSCTVSAGNNATCYTNLDLSAAVRLSTTGNPNCGSFWGTTTIDWRLYQAQNGNAIITVADGCTLKLVQFTYTTSNNGVLKLGDTIVASGEGVECSGNQVEFTVGNSSEKTNGQVRITTVKVIYTGEGTLPPIEDPQPGEKETTITLASAKNVYVGETVELGATANVEATITYDSEDTSIATVDASGVVTGVSVGSVKVWARVAASAGNWTAAEKYCTVTVQEKPVAQEGIWTEFGISNIQEGDEFVIVGNNYAMTNANGTASAPSAVAVTISDGKITSDVTDAMVWTLTGNSTDGLYTFYPKGSTEKWLYCNTTAASSSNNNLRVGTGDRKVFTVETSEAGNFLVTKDDYTARYVAMYNNADWRGYVSKNTSPTPIQFFKKVDR